MGNLLKIWLMIGLFTLARLAIAEEPPTQKELEQIRAWNDLFLSPNPVFQDSEKQFMKLRYFSTDESRARDSFMRQPQTRAALAEARKDIAASLDQTLAGAADSIPAFSRQIPIDPASDTLLSFQRFWQENSKKKNSMTEPEAERLARFQLEQRYGRLDLSDFNQRREFQRETQRFLLSAEGRKTAPRFSESDFQEWKVSEILRLKAAREANMESFARLSVEFSPESMRVGKANADGVLSRASLRALTAADLEGAKFIHRPVKLHVRETLGLENENKAAVAWFVKLKNGEELGIDSRGGSHVQRKFPNAAAAEFSTNEFFRAPAPKRERLLAYFAASHAESALAELDERVRDKIRYRPDPRELEAVVSRATKELNSVKSALNSLLYWDTQILFVRGLLKDPDFWKKRDAQAKALGLGKFPLGKDDPPKQGLFSGWSRYGRDGGGGSLPAGPRSSQSLSGAPTRAENTAKEVVDEAKKNILFKTDKIIPGKGPKFYSLFDTTKVGEAKRIDSFAGKPTISVTSAQPFQPRAGLVVVPTPGGHELSRLELKDANGRRLEAGKDFKVLKGKDGYAIEMGASDGLFEFRAGFRPVAEGALPEFSSLEKSRLARIKDDLAAANLRALSEGVGELLKKEKVSIRDLESLFRQESLYSYNPEPNLVINTKEAKGPFADFSRFVDAQGRACFQCDGSNSLFRQVLEEYFEGKAQVRNVSGFASAYRNLKEDHLHLITKVEVPGFAPLMLDATPVTLDRGRALPNADRLVAQATKLDLGAPTPKPQYVENFRRDLAESKAKFLKVAEPVRLNFKKGDPWLNVGKATAVLDDYLEGGRSLEEAGEELKKFFPGRRIEFGTHDDFMSSLAELAREDRATLAKAVRYARENPHIPGGSGYSNSAVVAATDRRLEILAQAEEALSADNFSQYRAARAPATTNCSEMFGALRP